MSVIRGSDAKIYVGGEEVGVATDVRLRLRRHFGQWPPKHRVHHWAQRFYVTKVPAEPVAEGTYHYAEARHGTGWSPWKPVSAEDNAGSLSEGDKVEFAAPRKPYAVRTQRGWRIQTPRFPSGLNPITSYHVTRAEPERVIARAGVRVASLRDYGVAMDAMTGKKILGPRAQIRSDLLAIERAERVAREDGAAETRWTEGLAAAKARHEANKAERRARHQRRT